MRPLPVPTCPSGYTLKDLVAFFHMVQGEKHPLWAVAHNNEVLCSCPLDQDEKSHGIVHPVEAFRPWWEKYHG